MGEKVVLLMVALPILCVLWSIFNTQDYQLWGDGLYSTSVLLFGYCIGCIAISPYFLSSWINRKFLMGENRYVAGSRREMINIGNELGIPLTEGSFANLLAKIPGNQATQLALEHVCLKFENLPKALEGLKVVQLSDLHLTGQVRIEYFQELVRRVNELEPDLILITGDLVDEVHCLDWIEPIFGQLNSKSEVLYVFGNHDLRIKDSKRFRERLKNAGLTDVGGNWKILEINGCKVGFAGNELPWFGGAENLPFEPDESVDFKILLSHSPDQLEWAEPYRFDWMLAGHTHGGQIQFPLIGPIVAPSKFGVKYASGAFDLGHMLMYVSRGISGDEAIRISCPPEVGVFTLSSSTVSA